MYIPVVSHDVLLAIVAAAAFLAGTVVARLLFASAGKRREDPRNHRIRQLEADLRLLQRKHDEALTTLDEHVEQQASGEARIEELNARLAENDSALQQATREMKDAVSKTRELRQILADRAAETIREHVRAEEARTELDVIRAGSDVMASEFERMQAGGSVAGDDDEPEEDLLSDESLLNAAPDPS